MKVSSKKAYQKFRVSPFSLSKQLQWLQAGYWLSMQHKLRIKERTKILQEKKRVIDLNEDLREQQELEKKNSYELSSKRIATSVSVRKRRR